MTTTGQRTAQLHVPEITDDMDVMAAAFALTKAGFYVGPIDQGKKHAGSVLGKGWPAKTSRDPHEIAAWFAGTDYGLFIHVGRSGAVAFDVDDFGLLPDVLRVELERADVPYQSTRPGGSGRGHYLFTVPEGRQLGNARGQLGETGWGEIRGRNGIVVVQPTRHEKADSHGARYLWERGGPVPELPKSVADMLPDGLSADDASSDAEVAAFLAAPAQSRRGKPQLIAPILRRFTRAVEGKASRHETATGCAVHMLREARAGFYPAGEAISALRQAFLDAIGNDRPAATASAEFDGIVSWATAQAIATPLQDVLAITERTGKEYKLGARPAEVWPAGATATRPTVTAPASPPASVEEALAVTDARVAAAAPPVEAPVEPVVEAEGARDSPAGDVDQAAAPDDAGDQLVDPHAAANLRTEIDVTNEPTGIVELVAAIDRGTLPDTYVRQGIVVRVGEVAGADRKAAAVGSTVDVQTVDPDVLRLLLAQHADVIKWRAGGKDSPAYTVPASPSVAALKSVLSERNWRKLPHLAGIVTAPVLRPDGSLLQEPGYDELSGLYYAPAFDVPAIPDDPEEDDVRDALALVFGDVLGDFPWKDAADLANYTALLMTPILRPYVGGLSPLGAISASERGSGKTLLTTVIGELFRMTSRPWVSSDDEIRKSITTALMTSTKPVILFDNVGDQDAVAAPSLAKLLTSRQWDDRLLHSNNGFDGTNDRLWLVTGNSIEFGGDIAQRTILVRLDPDCPDPDLRSGFTIPDLDEWLENDENKARLLRALLILARAWIAAGAPVEEYVMRGFKRWACGLGGFLMYHGIPKFLANREELKEHDEEAQTWNGFLATWHRKFGVTPQTAADIRRSAERDNVAGLGFGEDPWKGTFITKKDGVSLPSAGGLGMMLKRRRDRFYSGFQLRGMLDQHEKVWVWSVVPVEQDE